jgi:phosphate transport system substrate-binding protein
VTVPQQVAPAAAPPPTPARRRIRPENLPVIVGAAVIVIVLTTVFYPLLSHKTSSKLAASVRLTSVPYKPACATGSLTVIGSTSFQPIAQDSADAYMHACPGARINIEGGDSAYGLTQVRDAAQSDAQPAGSMIAMYDGSPSGADTAPLSAHPVGVLIFSIVAAHSGPPFGSSITASQLRTIFVNPGEQGIVAVGRRAGSGTRLTFIRKVLDLNPDQPGIQPDKGSCPPPTGSDASFTSCTEDSTADLLRFVSRTPNAIGYAEVSQAITGNSRVRMLSIGGVSPSAANVLNGSYKLWTTETLYTTAQPKALTKDFLAFLSHRLTSSPPAGFIACSAALTRVGAGC